MGNVHIQGIIPPMITPLEDMNSLDVPGLEKLVEHILSGGVHGLFILGTTGEAQSLSYELRHELIERVCRQVGKRVPVLVGISDTSLVESMHLAEKAFAEGATAVVSAPPYYYAPAQQELIDFYQSLADVLPLPLFLYNMPSHVKVKIEPATLKAIAQHPNVIGLKDSSSDMVYFHSLIQIMKDKEGFSLLVGPEELTAEAVLLGADGGVNGGANMFPSLYVNMYKAAKSRDLDTVLALQQQIMYISNSIYKIGKYGSSYLKGVKCTCSLLGLCSDYMALPFQRFNAPERKRVGQILENLGYTVINP
ncbi:MAG: dihydrodipicolinate synthase family protein [Bacteroidales bacterium]|jgi:4-hydroxy-tetrahydrodipicolinate synthase|nr:dihydrodipicolinate synthase family protein [Bacteroidales bacterium]HNZ80769.1 dihydrodipicolinate synthase family protein [Bacteroidales bacterium]HOD26509.1 dihydrodipicolinate synthase family protein [Bacteroidales bacterium]HOH24316.1 dihydrodipicolinate synthase family protein [Bacteroidales bacterium]HPH57544.1 dihydrodipicolinate synthase family protein [Bacteroidales bacterium]